MLAHNPFLRHARHIILLAGTPGSSACCSAHSRRRQRPALEGYGQEFGYGPDGTLQDIEVGEERTMDYSFHGNPRWYREACSTFVVLTEREIAERY